MAGQVTEMVDNGSRTHVLYGADRQRLQSVDYATMSGGTALESVVYLGDVEYRASRGETRRFLPGGLVISHRDDGSGSRRWALVDHQGSTDRIVNRFGTVAGG